MKVYLFLSICVFAASCHPKVQQIRLPEGDLLKASWTKYKVERIDSIGNVYLIYGRTDSGLFKILSHKIPDSAFCRDIFIGGVYNFRIHTLFPAWVGGMDNRISREELTGVMFYGTDVHKEEGCVPDLFFSDNIKGLCYK